MVLTVACPWAAVGIGSGSIRWFAFDDRGIAASGSKNAGPTAKLIWHVFLKGLCRANKELRKQLLGRVQRGDEHQHGLRHDHRRS